MIFAVDIGNSNIVAGCIDASQTYFSERISTDYLKTSLEYAIIFKNILELHRINAKDVEGSILASVVPPVSESVEEAIQKVLGSKPLVVGPGIKTGLNIRIDNPAQLGSDLVVGAVAALDQYPAPLIIFDMGTATTISVINGSKAFLGGAILPGVTVAIQSLSSKTAQLPDISLDPPRQVIGSNTIDSMKSGAIYGNACMMDGMIARIEQELGQSATVLATGGLSRYILPHCTRHIIYDENLLLKGLWLIFQKNLA